MDDHNPNSTPKSNVTELSAVKAAPKRNPFIASIVALGEPMHPFSVSFEGEDPLICMGLRIRDYFAAHAPEPPEWFTFKPHPDNRPPGRPALQDQPDDVRKAVVNGDENGGAPWHALIREYELALANWRAAIEGERALSWRWHYAGLMVTIRQNTAAQKD